MALHTTYEVRWKNFKGFRDTGWIKIKPITILLGTNNSGKTSFIAPLLLMNQTLASRDTASSLIVKGNMYDGGNIKELLNDYDLKKDIFLGFRYHIHEPEKKLSKIGSYPPGAVEVTLGVNNEVEREIIVKKEAVYDIFLRKFFQMTRDGNGKYSLEGLDVSKMGAEEKMAIEKSSPLNFLFSPNSLLSATLKEKEKLDEKAQNKRISKNFSTLLQAVAYNFSLVKAIVGDLSYIGPIRENPHRVYEVSNEANNTVGQRGENTPNLLKRHHKKIQKEINEWIRKFGFGDSLEFKELYGNLYSIRFREKDSQMYTSIANAGFGASQILPLIVQSIVSPKESLTIAEQPEIHLNPRLQCVLAELFVQMTKRDQRIIIETHSEHLILRLRRLIAQKEISSNDVALYFVEKKNGASVIREIKIEENGHIKKDEWPEGFFEETLRESLALAAEQSKNKKRV
jgi:predicted ATPase